MNKKSKGKRIQIPYPKSLGFVWTAIVIWIVISTKALRLSYPLLGDNWFVAILLLVLLFLPGSFLLVYGILLGEREPDLKPIRIISLGIVVALATLIVCSWLDLAINGL